MHTTVVMKGTAERYRTPFAKTGRTVTTGTLPSEGYPGVPYLTFLDSWVEKGYPVQFQGCGPGSAWIRIISVADQDSEDPHVFGPLGLGSGFGSFYHQAKIVRKTLIPNVLWLIYDFLSLKNDVNVPSKSNKQKNLSFPNFHMLTVNWQKVIDLW
jgi:hypothetical protein